MRLLHALLVGVLSELASVTAFVSPSVNNRQSPLLPTTVARRTSHHVPITAPNSMVTSSATSDVNPSSPVASTAASLEAAASSTLSPTEQRKQEQWKKIRKEGGLFAFNTKYGALNPFAIYYGLVAIFFGIPWFFALTACQLFYLVTRNKIDTDRRLPTHINQLWGNCVMLFTNSYPTIENQEILKRFYAEKRPAMFVANHNSWMDIPFMGHTLGWRNYKTISKVELGKVPILGKAIKVCGNIMVDRSDRKSQLKTLKKGIDYLKVRACLFVITVASFS